MLFNVWTDTRIIKVIEKYLIGNILEKIFGFKTWLSESKQSYF